MKKICIFSVALFSSFVCFAQVEFGIFAGPHASSATYSVNVKQSTDYKFGFHVGAEYKIPFDNNLFFTPAISYRLMGYKVVFNQPSFPPDLLAKDNNTSFHEIDIDPLLQYEFSKKPSHFFFRAGPSFNFILSGKEEFNLATGEHIDRKMKFSVTNSYGRFLVSVLGELGFETSSGYTISAQFIQGLISMNNEDEGPFIRNRSFGVTVGKFFKPKKR